MRKFIFTAVCLSLLSMIGHAETHTMAMPRSLQVIGEEAFYGDTSLNQVILPNGLTTIGERAFAYSSVKNINLPESIVFIADNAFEGCVFERVSAKGEYCREWCENHGIQIDTSGENETEWDTDF